MNRKLYFCKLGFLSMNYMSKAFHRFYKEHQYLPGTEKRYCTYHPLISNPKLPFMSKYRDKSEIIRYCKYLTSYIILQTQPPLLALLSEFVWPGVRGDTRPFWVIEQRVHCWTRALCSAFSFIIEGPKSCRFSPLKHADCSWILLLHDNLGFWKGGMGAKDQEHTGTQYVHN